MPAEASAPHGLAFDAATVDEPGGTLAFVATASGTFAVAALPSHDEVRVVRVDASSVDEEQLIVRTVGKVELSNGDLPTRVVADGHGRAVVALTGGSAVVTIDPLSGAVVARTATCTTPRALAVDSQDTLWVGCENGAVVSRLADGLASQHVGTAIGPGFHVLDADAGRFVLYGDGGPVDDALEGEGLSAWVSGGDAYVGRSGGDPVHVGAPGVALAIAAADITSQATTRRVLAVQTTMPHMLALYTLTPELVPVSIEPIE